MSDHTLKRLTKKFFSPKGSANRLKTTDSEGRLGRKHKKKQILNRQHSAWSQARAKRVLDRQRCELAFISSDVNWLSY